MGYVMSSEGFAGAVEELRKEYRILAPVCRKGEGRFTDTDVVLYEEIREAGQIELEKKSDYAFKEFLTPLSETLFFFTENECREADLDPKPVLIFLRSCDMHALKRLDQIYLQNGTEKDWFFQRRRELLKFALIGCTQSFENCFCVSAGTNITEDGYLFSVEPDAEGVRVNVPEERLRPVFEAHSLRAEEVVPAHAEENTVRVRIPERIPQSVLKAPLWDEYTSRCIGCGRCNFACPTCSCYTMQDIYYTDNGRVGERRRVASSCMVDGYTNVAGGGQYRRTQGERMRFKVLHKIIDFRKRFGYDMCVGCGRCDDICPEYISYTNIINKVCEASGEVAKA